MRRVTSAVVLAVAVLAVAGCGGDDNQAGADTSTETTQTTEAGGSGGEALTGSVGPGFEISLDKTRSPPAPTRSPSTTNRPLTTST